MKEFLVYLPKKEETIAFSLHNVIQHDAIYVCGCKTIQYQDKEYDVFVDGEIYNQEAIQKELAEEQFPLCTNVEELFLYAYVLWGKAAMEHLEGAYSFTIRKGNTIFTAKDPLGLKPIFYIDNEQGIWISNKISTLLENSNLKPVLDADGIRELFAFGPSISEDKTLYRDIYALPMGSLIQVRNGKLAMNKYYHLHAAPHTDSLDETIQKVHDLMSDSIKAQQVGCDACFLSGGLDSSIITSVVSQSKKNCHTYSLDYEGNKESFKGNMYQVSLDNSYIDEMCEYCSCDHSYLVIRQQELLNYLTKAMLARDCPGMADVDSSLLWLSAHVAEHEKVILSGECSDEIFGGYPWFYRDELKDLDTFPWLRSTNERIALLNKNIKDLDYDNYIQKQYENSIQDIEYLASDSEEDRRARLHTVLCLHWFMQTLVTRQLCEGDMAGLNIRAPFANVKLLEYVYNIPWDMKFLNKEEKGILRKAFEQELPECIAHRKKNPFPKTHNPVYAELISEKLKERYDDPKSPLHILFDDEKLKELIDSKGASYQLPWYGQLMSGPQLLAYMYQIDQWILKYNIEIVL